MNGFVDVSCIIASGVYVLCWGDEVVYVGKARNVYKRLHAHRTLWQRQRKERRPILPGLPKAILFNRVWVMPCKYVDCDRIERELIARFAPRRNKLLRQKFITTPTKIKVEGFEFTLCEASEPVQIERRV